MQNKIYNTKGLVEAGLITAILVVLALMNIYVPIFTTLGRFILPIPVTVLYLRQNIKMTITSIIVSGVIIAMVYSPFAGLTSAIMFGITGITLGYCIKKDRKISITLLLLSIASFIGTVTQLIVYIKLIANSSIRALTDEMVKMMRESFDLTINIYTSMGVTKEQLKPFYDLINMFNTEYVLKLIPAILVISSFVFAYLTYIITKAIIKKLGYEIKPMTSISQIRIDIKFTTIIAILLLLGVVLVRRKVPSGEYLTLSAQTLLQYIFVLQGIAVAVYYLKNKFHLAKGFIILIILITFFSPISMIYVMIGLSDIILDFRKIDPNRNVLRK
ncbi:YybS family protein [Clostridium rectalis]|uniref:YybS family protein n=1 Tax=Clostridium rectalis TaxID=2040295 RepID=UPI000F6442F3|nr:YybS family protein [Clostridium rectalis]